jgi:hypothetical protein
VARTVEAELNGRVIGLVDDPNQVGDTVALLHGGQGVVDPLSSASSRPSTARPSISHAAIPTGCPSSWSARTGPVAMVDDATSAKAPAPVMRSRRM